MWTNGFKLENLIVCTCTHEILQLYQIFLKGQDLKKIFNENHRNISLRIYILLMIAIFLLTYWFVQILYILDWSDKIHYLMFKKMNQQQNPVQNCKIFTFPGNQFYGFCVSRFCMKLWPKQNYKIAEKHLAVHEFKHLLPNKLKFHEIWFPCF